MARRVKPQLAERATSERESRCLHRVLVADDRDAAVHGHGVADCGCVSPRNIFELLTSSCAVCVVQIGLQLIGEGLGDRCPPVSCPMGELARFGQSMICHRLQSVTTCDRRGSLHCSCEGR